MQSASFSKAALHVKDYRTYKPRIVYFKNYLSMEICANGMTLNLLKFFLISVNYKNTFGFFCLLNVKGIFNSCDVFQYIQLQQCVGTTVPSWDFHICDLILFLDKFFSLPHVHTMQTSNPSLSRNVVHP